MNREVHHLKRKLFWTIYNRLNGLNRKTNSPYFKNYRMLWKNRCKGNHKSQTDDFSMDNFLIEELTKEMNRVKSLSKKDFKIEFGKQRKWESEPDIGKWKINTEMKNKHRTKFHELNSQGFFDRKGRTQ